MNVAILIDTSASTKEVLGKIEVQQFAFKMLLYDREHL